MATPESKVKAGIRERLDDMGVYYGQPTTGGYGRSGQLDFICCMTNHFVAIEAKSVHSKYGMDGPTALQWDDIDAVGASGGIAMCVDENNLNDVIGVARFLATGKIIEARRLARDTLDRYERPTLTPATETQPTIRKTRTK
jgi:hypothetical protein